MNRISIFKGRYVSVVFLISSISLGIFLRWQVAQAPLQPYQLQKMVMPNIDFSTLEILRLPYHSELFLYKTIVANWFYGWFGLNEITYRVLAFTLSLATLFLMYRFTAREIGGREACIAVLLFSVCLYSLWTIKMPDYGSFYMFVSFTSFYFLWRAFHEGRWFDWAAFAVFNFLNLTNMLMAFLFVPAVVGTAGVLLVRKIVEDGKFSASARNRGKQFLA